MCFPFNPLSPQDAIKHHFTSPKKTLNFPTTKGFRTKISMKLVHKYMEIYCTFSPTLNHLHTLQVENCDSNSRLVWMKMTLVNLDLKGVKGQGLKQRLTTTQKTREVEPMLV